MKKETTREEDYIGRKNQEKDKKQNMYIQRENMDRKQTYTKKKLLIIKKKNYINKRLCKNIIYK